VPPLSALLVESVPAVMCVWRWIKVTCTHALCMWLVLCWFGIRWLAQRVRARERNLVCVYDEGGERKREEREGEKETRK